MRVTPEFELEQLAAAFSNSAPGKGMLIASDFDGTLAPIVARPDAARALPMSMDGLERLSGAGARVAVISGRSREALETLVPLRGAILLGDYGLERATARERLALDRFEAAAGKVVDRHPGAVLEPKPGSASVHFRHNPQAGPELVAELAPLAAELGLRASTGRMVLEVRPSRADKGAALVRLVRRFKPNAVLFAGDDEGDRTAFEVVAGLPGAHLTVGVASAETAPDVFAACDALVPNPQAFARLLSRVADLTAGRAGPAAGG